MNLKKILFSLATIGVVAAAGIAVSGAYFTDNEASRDNEINTGTIDISVNENNPWRGTGDYKLEDLKPGQTDYIDFEITNVGTNPANIYKTLQDFVFADGVQSEPECNAEDGRWDGQTCTRQQTPDNDLSKVIYYDLRVEVYDASTVKQWWQTIYTLDDMQTLAAVYGGGDSVYLGEIPAGWSMKVMQSYHMSTDAGNVYQGDTMTFKIHLLAEQLKGYARLENKVVAEGDLAHLVLGDTIGADLNYSVKDRTFTYSLVGTAPLNSTAYSFVAYEESFSSPSATGWPRTVVVLGSTTSGAAGEVNMSGDVNLGYDLLNMKLWLVKTADLSGSTMVAWNGTQYLLDTGLLDYYDADAN